MREEEILEVAKRLPFSSPSDEEARRLENQLYLRARLTPQRTPPGRKAGSSARPLALAASFLLVVLAAGALGRAITSPVEEAPYGLLRASEDASFVQELTRAGEHRYELVRLEHGSLRVSVRKLRPGDRFVIAVGAEEVEVRGTRFVVTAEHGRLLRVAVEEGRVEVRPRAEAARLLLPGDVWHRPSLERPKRLSARAAPTLAAPPPRPAPIDRAASEPAPATAATDEGPAGAERGAEASRAEVLEEHLMEAKPKSRPDQSAARPAPVRPRLPRQDVEAAFLRAWQLHKRGQFEEAAELFLRVMESGDEHDLVEDALFWRGVALDGAGRRASAIDAARQYLERYPDATRREAVELRLAWLELSRGHHAAARALFLKLAQSDKITIKTEAQTGLERVDRPAEPKWLDEH